MKRACLHQERNTSTIKYWSIVYPGNLLIQTLLNSSERGNGEFTADPEMFIKLCKREDVNIVFIHKKFVEGLQETLIKQNGREMDASELFKKSFPSYVIYEESKEQFGYFRIVKYRFEDVGVEIGPFAFELEKILDVKSVAVN